MYLVLFIQYCYGHLVLEKTNEQQQQQNRERCKCHLKSVWGRAFGFDPERYFKSVLCLSGSTRSGQKNVLHLMLNTVSFNRIEQLSQQQLVLWPPWVWNRKKLMRGEFFRSNVGFVGWGHHLPRSGKWLYVCESVEPKQNKSSQSKWPILLFLLFVSSLLCMFANETHSRRISDERSSIYKRKI